MKRCTESEGEFQVTFEAEQSQKFLVPVHSAVNTELPDGTTATTQLFNQDGTPAKGLEDENAPLLDTEEPWSGELCTHELQWLRDPRNFNPGYRITVE